MFDTHCHLNFSAFKKNLDDVIYKAKLVGVKKIVVPSTKLKNCRKAIEIAEKYEGAYVAVGIHPHHIYKTIDESTKILSQVNSPQENLRGSDIHFQQNFIDSSIIEIEKLLQNDKVVAVGEVGLDYYEYEKTVYENYQVTAEFVEMQKELLIGQIKLAVKYHKSLILHNRGASQDLMDLLEKNWDKQLAGRTVLHCCESEVKLLEFAKQHKIYLGVDGDVTFSKTKQDFIRLVPLEMLVLETDSPLLLPESLRSKRLYPNKPENIKVISAFVADLLKIPVKELERITFANSCRLFGLPEN